MKITIRDEAFDNPNGLRVCRLGSVVSGLRRGTKERGVEAPIARGKRRGHGALCMIQENTESYY